jgi:raffinose/stachyose/melibiose transport system permease protein
MRAHFATAPAELTDAARTDGVNTWQLFWRVHVPLARPAISWLAILLFL